MMHQKCWCEMDAVERKADLELMRKELIKSLDLCKTNEIAGITRELRAVNAELEQMTTSNEEVNPVDGLKRSSSAKKRGAVARSAAAARPAANIGGPAKRKGR